MSVSGNDDVLDEGDAEELAGVAQAGGDLKIFRRGLRRAGGVVVGDDNRGGVMLERWGEDVARMDDGSIHCAD